MARGVGTASWEGRIHSVLEFTCFIGDRAPLSSPAWSQCFEPSVPASQVLACRHVPLYLTALFETLNIYFRTLTVLL